MTFAKGIPGAGIGQRHGFQGQPSTEVREAEQCQALLDKEKNNGARHLSKPVRAFTSRESPAFHHLLMPKDQCAGGYTGRTRVKYVVCSTENHDAYESCDIVNGTQI